MQYDFYLANQLMYTTKEIDAALEIYCDCYMEEDNPAMLLLGKDENGAVSVFCDYYKGRAVI